MKLFSVTGRTISVDDNLKLVFRFLEECYHSNQFLLALSTPSFSQTIEFRCHSPDGGSTREVVHVCRWAQAEAVHGDQWTQAARGVARRVNVRHCLASSLY